MGSTSTAVTEDLLQHTNKVVQIKTSGKVGNTTTGNVGTRESSSIQNGSKSMMQWYESYLMANPVKTKMVTGGILWVVGDVVAQIIPPLIFSSEDENGQGEKKQIINYDYGRTGRAVVFGSIIHAPCAHIHYNFLETLTVKAGITGLKIPVFKAVMEQFVYWSWFSNSLYHGAMGGMQGLNATQIYNRIADVLWETQKAQWVFWIPVQLLNFRFIPVRHQLNVVLLTSVVWTALLSAWYPPEVPKTEGKKQK